MYAPIIATKLLFPPPFLSAERSVTHKRKEAARGSEVGSQAILEHLERANLFIISLDNRREWYRYHHPFADLLRYRLQRTYGERLTDQAALFGVLNRIRDLGLKLISVTPACL